MGMVSNTLFTARVNAGHRTYFINVMQSVNGTRYLQVNESRRVDEGQYQQSCIFVPEEHIEELCDGLREAANFLSTLPPVPERPGSSAPVPFRRTDEPWSSGEEVRVRRALEEGHSVEEIANVLLRHPDALESHLAEMGLAGVPEPEAAAAPDATPAADDPGPDA